MKFSSMFSGPLVVKRLHGDYRQVQVPFYQILNTSRTEVVWIPQGYVTDLASVPKWAQWIYTRSHEDYAQAAVVHDWLVEGNETTDYETMRYVRKVSRWEADKIFYEGMKASGAEWHKRYIMFFAVSLNTAWKKVRSLV